MNDTTEKKTESVLTRAQSRKFRADFTDPAGYPGVIVAMVRYDDHCGNGHNSFAITADIYGPDRQPGEPRLTHKSGKSVWVWGCGCMHDEIAAYLPELAPLLKWHLCSTDGPMHYVANTTYHASDRDHNGLRAGEFKHMMDRDTGLPLWKPSSEVKGCGRQTVASADKPAPLVVEYVPYGIEGKGKPRDLDAARSCAIWPDATDEELTAPDLKERLIARLPALMDEFRAMVESLGFTY